MFFVRGGDFGCVRGVEVGVLCWCCVVSGGVFVFKMVVVVFGVFGWVGWRFL